MMEVEKGERRIRVLLADDQRINRMVLARCLDPSRYEVFEASDGLEAVERFDEARPDIVLLDVMMPRMDGFEAADAIKSRSGDDFVPIIMVTSLADEESLTQGMEAGADDFVRKPPNKLILEAKMKAALRTRSLFRTVNQSHQEVQRLLETSHEEQVMAERLMARLIRTEALDGPIFKYRSRPMDVFNGDLLMAARTIEGRTRLMLGDFAGHGLAAAIGGLPVASDFERLARAGASLIETARVANSALRQVLPRDRFMSALLVDVDQNRRAIEVLNAGMPPLLIRRPGGGIRHRAESTHPPLGILKEILTEGIVQYIRCEENDRIYLYSDGLTEAPNLDGDAFGEDRFESLLSELSDDQAVFDEVLGELDGFVGEAPADDDVTLVEIHPDAKRGHAAQRASLQEATTTRVSFHLKAAVLKTTDVPQMAQSILEAIAPLEGRRAEVFVVLTELLANALDHGVLRLDSALKKDADGFIYFYEERARRLETLDEGAVSVALELRRLSEQWRLYIDIEDSGPGFDVAKINDPDPDQYHGKGLALVRELCESVTYRPPGNRVEVVYRWATDQSTGDFEPPEDESRQARLASLPAFRSRRLSAEPCG